MKVLSGRPILDGSTSHPLNTFLERSHPGTADLGLSKLVTTKSSSSGACSGLAVSHDSSYRFPINGFVSAGADPGTRWGLLSASSWAVPYYHHGDFYRPRPGQYGTTIMVLPHVDEELTQSMALI
jgi:hypothetical protein